MPWCPPKGVIPPGLLGYSDALTGTGLDLEGAKELLAGTGFGPDGEPLKLVLTVAVGDSDLQLITQSLKSNLAELNIDLDVQATEWQPQWDRAKSENVADRQDIFIMYWWPDYPGSLQLVLLALPHARSCPTSTWPTTPTRSWTPMIDGIQALTATDRAAAEQQYVEMQQMLIDDAVVVVPYVQNYQRVLDATVGGYVDDPAYAQVAFVYDLVPEG